MVERSVNNMQWKRCSAIGTLKDSDNLNTIKEKSADAFHLSVPTGQLVLVRAGAKIDDREFLSCLSAQQQSKISFGIGFEVSVKVIQIYTRFTFCWYIIHQEDEVSLAMSRSARSKTATPYLEHGISAYRSRES